MALALPPHRSHFYWAAALRVGLLLYSVAHDRLLPVPYTDIDYHVFSDAAALCAAGRSPFERPTYRYTPLLAWLLVPNVVFPMFGKILFAACDVLCGSVLASILRQQGESEAVASRAAAVWWFNGITAVIATRGSCDAVLVLLVLASLTLLLRARHRAAAATLGLAIHFRIYPVIYLPIFALYAAHQRRRAATAAPAAATTAAIPKSTALHALAWSASRTQRSLLTRLQAKSGLLLSHTAAETLLISIGVAVALTLAMAALAGPAYLTEGLLHHSTRADARHNYSLYFLPFYLLPRPHAVLGGLLAFVPQAAAVLGAGVMLFCRPPAAMLVATILFVALNKVCTAQYFVWFLSLAPLVLPTLGRTRAETTTTTTTKAAAAAADGHRSHTHSLARAALWWLGAQTLWLLFAYALEHRGVAVFGWLWMASVALLLATLHGVLVVVRAL
jgi:GPI mannosyltransferase 1 subunit M